MSDVAAEHRLVAAAFTERVLAVAPPDWDRPAPCAGWRARDVVGHLVEWLPALLSSGAGVELPAVASVEDDPVGAWLAHTAAVQALLDDPTSAGKTLVNEHIGSVAVPEAIDRFYTGDVFLHTWDLARATGQDERLDERRCAAMLAGMLPLDGMLRESGQFGPRVEVAPDADAQTRLLGFIGRRP